MTEAASVSGAHAAKPTPDRPPRGSGDKLITCVLPSGRGHDILMRLKTEKNVITCVLNNARGIGIATLNEIRNVGPLSEKDVLQLVAPPERADELFEWLYFEAGVDAPHGGFMYQQALAAATVLLLPDLPPEQP